MIYFHRCNFKSPNLNSKEYTGYLHQLSYKLLDRGLKLEYNLNLQSLKLVKDVYGKPRLKDYEAIKFNISHCNGMIACSLNNSEVGIDVEDVKPFDYRVASKILTSSELNIVKESENQAQTFFKLWTLKESFIKCIGTGFNYSLPEISFCLYKNIRCNHSGFIFKQYLVFDSFILSMCTKKT